MQNSINNNSSSNILENMKKFEIDFMNTKNGKLVYTENPDLFDKFVVGLEVAL